MTAVGHNRQDEMSARSVARKPLRPNDSGRVRSLAETSRTRRSRLPRIADFGLASSADAEYISTSHDLLSFSHFVYKPLSGVKLLHFMEEIT
jgi:hypothetical protein